jgi:hypothetical protein
MQTRGKNKNVSLTLLLSALLVLAPAVMAAAASISTDMQDYEPGGTVIFAGSGFTPGEVVNLLAEGSTNGTRISVDTAADAAGNINGSFTLPLMYEQTYTLTATGATSGSEASTLFHDSVGQFIIDSPPSPISLYPGDANVLTVSAKSTAGGGAAQGVPVNWTTTDPCGTLTLPFPVDGKTGSDGKASITYTAGSTPGSYTVTATAPNAGPSGHDKVVSWAITILTPAIPGDTNAPTTTITLNPSTPNGTNDWYTCDVNVTLTATDNGGSGVKEIHYILNGGAEVIVSAATVTFSIVADGNHTLDYWAVDNADNEEDTQTATIKIDKTAPVVTITVPADGNFYRTDTLPGLAYSVVDLNPYTVDVNGWSTDEGEHTVTVKATDEAGNVGSASVTYTVDNTPPVTEIALSGLAGNNGWYRSDVNVTLTATDTSSGVQEIHYILDGGTEIVVPDSTTALLIAAEGVHTLEYWAVDNVGNHETPHSQEIKIDKTPPTISGSRNPAANSYGWNNEDVTVSFETSDALSGIDPATDPCDVVLSSEGAGQSVTRTVYDMAGNSASATVSDINIDKTNPVVTITVPADGASYLLNQNVLADWSATDALSGIDQANTSGTVPSGSPIPTGTVGPCTFTVTAADKAGNTTTVTNTYHTNYDFIGFLPPVDNPDVVNVGKAGRTFPIKWQLKDANGNFISDLSVVLYNPLRYCEAIGESKIWDDPIPGETSGSSGLRYDSTSNQYIFTWKTSKSFAGKSYELLLELDDGSVHTAMFRFTK